MYLTSLLPFLTPKPLELLKSCYWLTGPGASLMILLLCTAGWQLGLSGLLPYLLLLVTIFLHSLHIGTMGAFSVLHSCFLWAQYHGLRGANWSIMSNEYGL